GSVGAVITDASSSDGASAFYLSSAASFLTNFNLQLSLPRFSISANGLYKQRAAQKADPIKAVLSKDYFLLNGKAELNFLNKKAHLFTQVDNIFDRAYSDLLGADMPGRWLMFGAKFIL
ncbi:MAG TPA: TonB-dependent receptor, partial [Flavisolibacter sp.]